MRLPHARITARRAVAFGILPLLVIAGMIGLQASTAPAASGVFSLDRLRLGGPTGNEDYLFTAGNVIYPDGGADTGSYYKSVVTDSGGTVRNAGFPCTPASSFSSTDNAYTIQPSDPASTGTGWKYTLKQYATADCTGGAAKTASKTFYVAQATVYADAALTTPKSFFGAGATAYVTATGATPSLTGWSTTWILPSGATACANTSGTDRPDSSSSSNLPPKWTASYLQYRPNTTATGSAWNREANYDVRPCPSFGAGNEGTWKLRLDGNATNFVVLTVFTVDTTRPPAPTITSSPADLSKTASATFGFSDSEGGVGFRCQFDGAAFTACSSPTLYPSLSDGSHTFRVKAVDAAGNESDTTARTWTVDTTPPPSPTINSFPANPSNSVDASFGFSDTEVGAGFRCQLDGGGFGACSSPATYSGLAEGSHTFDVVAVDTAGNESGATTHTWTIDTTPPLVFLTTPADGSSTTDPKPTFSGSAGSANGDSSAVTVLVYSGSSATGTPVRTLSIVAGLDGSYSAAPSDPLPNGTYTAQAQQMDLAGNTGTSTANTFTVGVPASPENVSPPTISGTPQKGQTLTAAAGTWSGTPPPSYSYQWRRCDSGGANCVDIPNATEQSYALTDGDVGATIRVAVTGSNDFGSSTVSSAATQVVVVTVNAPSNTAPPTISGTAAVGETLAADPGQWSGAPAPSYTYQWRRCDSGGASCVDISGATAQNYVLAEADVDATVRVVVTAVNDVGSSTATSDPTAVVVQEPTNTSSPTISGTLREGQTLTANPGTWSGTQPISYAYQWSRCEEDDADCGVIPGATSATYTLTPAEAGMRISVSVTASNSIGTQTAATAMTPVVQAVSPDNIDAPTISGTAEKGQTLTASPGTWGGTPPMSYAYSWQRCDSTGAGCVAISGASSQSYSLTVSDIGSTIRVKVTASNSAGSSSALSDATNPVAGVYRAGVLADNPVGYWRLGETGGTTAADQTANNDSGTYLNGITLGAAGALVGD